MNFKIRYEFLTHLRLMDLHHFNRISELLEEIIDKDSDKSQYKVLAYFTKGNIFFE